MKNSTSFGIISINSNVLCLEAQLPLFLNSDYGNKQIPTGSLISKIILKYEYLLKIYLEVKLSEEW